MPYLLSHLQGQVKELMPVISHKFEKHLPFSQGITQGKKISRRIRRTLFANIQFLIAVPL